VEAVLALVGVALGAGLAPTLDWARQRARRREERRREMLEMVASYVTLVGDQLVAESEMQTELELGLTGSEQWSAEIGFRANAARWRLALVAPPDVADRGESFAATAESLRRAIRRAGGHWDGTVIAAEYDEWKDAEKHLIATARARIEKV
jgi:hypothetical protein